ncbi:hypothetical protein ABT160_02800 [Streptomyces sp. NPDC001941]|uniref:hypothetical protein n=1 Tax=Streptomyces sp. NPDC001941 TaxID=3154659 RepID=UPI0033345DA6
MTLRAYDVPAPPSSTCGLCGRPILDRAYLLAEPGTPVPEEPRLVHQGHPEVREAVVRRLRTGDKVLDTALGRVGIVRAVGVGDYTVRSEYSGVTWAAPRWDLEPLPPLRVGPLTTSPAPP